MDMGAMVNASGKHPKKANSSSQKGTPALKHKGGKKVSSKSAAKQVN
jgi:hypothetical protein